MIGATKVLRRLRSASRAARSLASRASFGRLGRPLAGRFPGRLAGGGVHGRLLLGDGLGVDLVGYGVADGDDRSEPALFHLGLGGERRSREGADDAGGGEGRDSRRAGGGAVHPAGTAVLPGGARERHVEACPFLPSRLPG
ncbi:hypothetical protein RKD29_005558 [Streptomyces tendae]